MDTVFIALKGTPILIARHRIGGSNLANDRDRLSLPGGYAITAGVPSAAWNDWAKANATSALVRNNMIHAEESLGALKAWCFAHAASRSGLAGAARG